MLRGDLDWIVMKCLEKDRTRRYETANGLAADIQRHLNDEPVAAGPPSASYRFKKLVRRNKGSFTAAAAVFVVLTLGVIGTTWGMMWAMDEQSRVLSQSDRASEALRQVTNEFSGAVGSEGDHSRIAPIASSTDGGEVEALAKTAVSLVRTLDAARTEMQRELTRVNELNGIITDMFGAVQPEEALAQTQRCSSAFSTAPPRACFTGRSRTKSLLQNCIESSGTCIDSLVCWRKLSNTCHFRSRSTDASSGRRTSRP